jgi:hypothetical protein
LYGLEVCWLLFTFIRGVESSVNFLLFVLSPIVSTFWLINIIGSFNSMGYNTFASYLHDCSLVGLRQWNYSLRMCQYMESLVFA